MNYAHASIAERICSTSLLLPSLDDQHRLTRLTCPRLVGATKEAKMIRSHLLNRTDSYTPMPGESPLFREFATPVNSLPTRQALQDAPVVKEKTGNA